MLEINELHAGTDGTSILNGLSLSVNAGEVHAIMGPNGSGKSTLAQVIAGHEDYHVTGGSVSYKGQDLLELEPEARNMLIGTALIIFVFRAIPSAGAGYGWFEIWGWCMKWRGRKTWIWPWPSR